MYIHIPWCVRKCPYCDFNSHEAREEIPEAAYIDALLADLETELPGVWGRSVSSIFIGGGTPSLLSPEALDRLLSGVRARLPLLPGLEVTMEANPGTFEAVKFGEFHAAGVNRLSIGVQSFNDQHLQALGRIHSRSAALRAADFAREAGFDSFNLDLMHGLPGQTLSQAMADLDTALALEPNHISWYQLTLEPNTWFYRHPPVLPVDDDLWAIQESGHVKLANAGFTQYEVSAFARHPDARSVHNQNYWQFGDYLGIGAGAHGKITDVAGARILRTGKRRSPKAYLDPSLTFESSRQEVAAEDLPLEFMLNGLRLIEGVPTRSFQERTGLGWQQIAEAWRAAVADGLMLDDPERLQATGQGQLFLNDLVARFMPEALAAANRNRIRIREV